MTTASYIGMTLYITINTILTIPTGNNSSGFWKSINKGPETIHQAVIALLRGFENPNKLYIDNAFSIEEQNERCDVFHSTIAEHGRTIESPKMLKDTLWNIFDFIAGRFNPPAGVYGDMCVQIVTALVVSLAFIAIAYSLSLFRTKISESLKEYECGFNVFDSATKLPFDVQFYIVGLLFLIFDLEISLIFPWVMPIFVKLGEYVSMTLFLVVVTIGFAYEWFLGIIDWPL